MARPLDPCRRGRSASDGAARATHFDENFRNDPEPRRF